MDCLAGFIRGLCGGNDNQQNDQHNYTKPNPTKFPTLNDIPLNQWQDPAEGQPGYKPSSIPQPNTSPPSTINSNITPTIVAPSQQELSNIRLAVEKLWALDANRLNPGLDYELFLQSAIKSNISQKMFRYVNESRIMKIPTYKYFYDLLDNYQSELGKSEKFGNKEFAEMDAFLKAFTTTKPGQYLHQYLVAKRLCSGDPVTFQKMLHDIWFKLYKRETHNDSSAFEHVFLGETTRDGQVLGLHNWLYFYYEEKAEHLTYHGYLPPNHSHPLQDPSGKEHLFQVRFTWNGCRKPIGTGFVGTSPEFELALYTLIFLENQDSISASFGGIETEIVVHSFVSGPARKIGSCYPKVK